METILAYLAGSGCGGSDGGGGGNGDSDADADAVALAEGPWVETLPSMPTACEVVFMRRAPTVVAAESPLVRALVSPASTLARPLRRPRPTLAIPSLLAVRLPPWHNCYLSVLW